MLKVQTYNLQNPKKNGTYFMVSVPPIFRRSYAVIVTQKLFCYTATLKHKPTLLASITRLSKNQPLYGELSDITEAGRYSLSEQGMRGMRIAIPRVFVKLAKIKPHHKIACYIDSDTLIYQKEK